MYGKNSQMIGGTLAALGAATAQAGVLGSFELNSLMSVGATIDHVELRMGMITDFQFGDEANEVLFAEGIEATTSNVGDSWTSGAEWGDLLRAQLQDDDSQDIIGMGGEIGEIDIISFFGGLLESDFEANGLDRELIAENTDAVRIELTRLGITQFRDRGPGGLTEIDLGFRVEFLSVPAPGTIMIGSMAIAGIIRRRR